MKQNDPKPWWADFDWVELGAQIGIALFLVISLVRRALE